MISHKLQQTFSILEQATFPTWKKANKKQKEQITKHLAKLEADMIMKEIEEECERRFPKT